MCLGTVYRGKKKREALASLPETMYVWKVVRVWIGEKKYRSQAYHFPSFPFRAGWNKTRPRYLGEGYLVAYHSFRKKSAALWWIERSSGNVRLIRCKVLKKDIVAIGLQRCEYNDCLVIVSTRVWMPKYKKAI